MDFRHISSTALATILLVACGQVDRGAADRFTSTGEMIAMSGGDAGAAHSCMACHGLDGLGNGDGAPRLAGLDRGYMVAQLMAYSSGQREHPEMAAIARKLTPTQQDAVSAYYAAMPFVGMASASSSGFQDGATLYHRGDAERDLAPCASCHGSQGEGIGSANPPLGGQPASYLAEQLHQWRAAKRRNDPEGMMLRISQALSPAESAALAEYASGLPGHSQRPESPAASPAEHRDDPRSDVSVPPRHATE